MGWESWREIRRRTATDHWEFRVAENHVKPVLRRKKSSNLPHPGPFLSARTDVQIRGKFAKSQRHLNKDDFPLCFLRGDTVSELCVTAGSSKYIKESGTPFGESFFISNLSGHLDVKRRGSETC